MCVCVWVGRLLWKCISCITFLFLIFHALWIYLNPLRWIEKEKKGKAEVRDMQNKKHPSLANVLPLSSFAFLILSSLFFFFHWRAFFWSHLQTLNPKPWPYSAGEREQGREEDSPSVYDCDYARFLRWWMDSLACFKPTVAERQRGEDRAEREDGCWEKWGML